MDSNTINSSEPQHSPTNAFFCARGVKEGKSEALKNRLRALIHAKGLSESDFYNSLNISKQHWYSISWGIWVCPVELKVKIAEALKVDSSVIWEDSK